METVTNEKRWVVYVHTCKINDKKYVGVTSRDPIKRWRSDGSGYSGQLFYKAIKKHGWENFTHEIVASDLTKEEASAMEIKLIKKLGSHMSVHGYNVSWGGEGVSGISTYHRLSPERQKEVSAALSASMRGEKNVWYGTGSPIAIKAGIEANSIPVCQYDMDGNFVREYKSASEAGRILNVDNGKISACAYMKIPTCAGYRWLFSSDKDNPELLNKVTCKMEKPRTGFSFPVIQYDEDMNFIAEFKSIKDASRAAGVDERMVAKVASGKKKSAYGYIWKYASENITPPAKRRVAKRTMDGTIIRTYENYIVASAETDIPSYRIRRTCNGVQGSAGGYKWTYEENMAS